MLISRRDPSESESDIYNKVYWAELISDKSEKQKIKI